MYMRNFMKELNEFWIQYQEIISESFKTGQTTVYRGVSNSSFDLSPAISRNNTEINTYGEVEFLESTILSEFKKQAYSILQNVPNIDIEWFFLMQHYGLPTRFFDWSSNPLVALFFAVERTGSDDIEVDGKVYYTTQMIHDDYHLFDYKAAKRIRTGQPADIFGTADEGKCIFLRPKYVDERYLNQKSILACPANPYSITIYGDVKEIIINRTLKKHIRKQLKMFGISFAYIYPGLQGIAAAIKADIFNEVSLGGDMYKMIKPPPISFS